MSTWSRGKFICSETTHGTNPTWRGQCSHGRRTATGTSRRPNTSSECILQRFFGTKCSSSQITPEAPVRRGTLLSTNYRSDHTRPAGFDSFYIFSGHSQSILQSPLGYHTWMGLGHICHVLLPFAHQLWRSRSLISPLTDTYRGCGRRLVLEWSSSELSSSRSQIWQRDANHCGTIWSYVSVGGDGHWQTQYAVLPTVFVVLGIYDCLRYCITRDCIESPNNEPQFINQERLWMFLV